MTRDSLLLPDNGTAFFDTAKFRMLHNARHFVTGEDKASLIQTNRPENLDMRQIVNKIYSYSLERELSTRFFTNGCESSDLKSFCICFMGCSVRIKMVRTANIEELARDLKLIIVMPDGSDGWYSDSETPTENRYELFHKRLVA